MKYLSCLGCIFTVSLFSLLCFLRSVTSGLRPKPPRKYLFRRPCCDAHLRLLMSWVTRLLSRWMLHWWRVNGMQHHSTVSRGFSGNLTRLQAACMCGAFEWIQIFPREGVCCCRIRYYSFAIAAKCFYF